MAFVRQVEGAHGGFEVGMAPRPLQSAEGDASCAPMGGRGMTERRDADVAFEDARPLGRCAASALDAAAAQGRGRGGQVWVIASRSGKEPGGVARGLPGEAQALQGVMRQGDRAVLGALAAVDVDQVARAIDSAHLQGKRFVQAQPTAVDGGAGDTMVPGGGGMEKTVHFFQAEQSRESVCRCGSHEVEGLPVAPKDVVGEEAEATVTDTHGTGRECSESFSVKQVWLEFRCRAEGRRCAIQLREQAYLSDRGLLRTFALATELQSGNHVLAQWCHDRPPLLR